VAPPNGDTAKTYYSPMTILFLILSLLVAQVASAATYWVNGSASGQNCVNSATDPGLGSSSQTIGQGISCLSAGDTLYIKAGTYTSGFIMKRTNPITMACEISPCIPSGPSPTQHTIISAAPGDERQVIKCCGGAGARGLQMYGYFKNITIRGIVFYGQNSAGLSAIGVEGICSAHSNPSAGVHVCTEEGFGYPGPQVVFENIEVHHWAKSGTLGWGHSTFRGCHIHHNGSGRFDHGIYADNPNTTIENCRIHHNSGFGIHVFQDPSVPVRTAHDYIVRNNLVYDNGKEGSTGAATFSGSVGGAGIIATGGGNNRIYNNAIFNNLGAGIRISDNCRDPHCHVYHNSVWNNGRACMRISRSAKVFIRNNVCWSNTFDGTHANGEKGTGILISGNPADNVVRDHNLNQSSDTQNPLFVNAAAGNFQLQSGSPAIDAGLALGAPFNVDREGVSRPQGKAYDIGAYEYQ
jgi:hypothetical protein